MKKLYTLVMLLAAAVQAHAAWDGTSAPWTAGDGTAESPYLIENEQQLAYLQSTVAEGETYAGKFFALTTDLDMSGDAKKVFSPIGKFDDFYIDSEYYRESLVFEGTFDGDYHTIDNLYISYYDVEELGGVGLFAVGRGTTEIKNLKLGANVVIDAPDSYSVGAVIGYCDGSKVTNCSMAGTVNGGGGEVGGIVGTAQPGTYLDGCVCTGVINAHTSCGGIVGYLPDSEVRNCFSSAELNCPGAYQVGGIGGWLYESTITNCVAIGKVTANDGSSWMPGKSPVCGELEESTAANCYYVAALTGCDPVVAQAGVKAVTEAELKSAGILEALNTDDAWAAGSDGYPVPAWTVSAQSAIATPDAIRPTIGVAGGAIAITACGQAVAIYDLSGRQVYSNPGAANLAFTPASRGIYLVRVGANAPVKIAL